MRLPVIIALAVLVAPSSAVAQALVNYQGVLVGQLALGMGGAVTAYPNDAAATYYNPAGLSNLRASSVAASFVTWAQVSGVIEDGLITPAGTSDLESTSNPDFSLFFGVVLKVGERDEQGIRRHTLGASTFSTYFFNQAYDTPISDGASLEAGQLHLRSEDELNWYGVTYSYRHRPDLSFGISGFLVERVFRSVEQETLVSGSVRNPDGTFSDSQFFLRQGATRLDAWLMAFRLGVLWRPTSLLQVGLMFQPPTITLAASGEVGDQLTGLDLAINQADFFSSRQDGLDGESPLPMELRLGLNLAPWRKDFFRVTFDISIYAPVGSASDPIRPVAEADIDPTFGRAPEPGFLVVPAYYTTWSYNVSLGLEGVLFDTVPFQGGFFTDLSASPGIDGPTNVYGPPDIDLFGATIALGVRTAHFSASVGLVAAFGSGDAYALDLRPDAEYRYVPTSAHGHSIFIHFTADLSGRTAEPEEGDAEGDAEGGGESEEGAPD